MDREGRRLEEERRLRRARLAALTHQAPEPEPVEHSDDREDDEAAEAAAHWLEQRALWVDQQIRRAMERGDFDNLPGAGKPIRGLGGTHDPDWWVKGLIERERITGVLPPALALRKEDAELDEVLDRQNTEEAVRRTLDDFNRRVVDARRQLQGGPPVVTPTRDVEAELVAWRARREERRARQREQLRQLTAEARAADRRARWWRRR